MNYPNRASHFAHKTFRLLHKTCFAATAGIDAFALIAIILHTEDAARYSGPVCFWNSQLQETLGFAKWDRLNRARQKAIDTGWLFYDSPGRRQIGTYFVTVPAGLEMITDQPLEPLSPAEGYKEGYNEGYKKGDKEGYKRGFTEGLQKVYRGDKQGEPSNPVPVPTPFPKELQTPAFESMWSEWLDHRKEIKKPLTATTTKKQLKKLAAMGEVRSLAALEHTIANGWQGIREPETTTGANNGRPALAVQREENEQSAVFDNFRAAAAAQCSESGVSTPARIGTAVQHEVASTDDDPPNGNVARGAFDF